MVSSEALKTSLVPGDEYDADEHAEFLAEIAGIAALPGGTDVGRTVCGAGFFGQGGVKKRLRGLLRGLFEVKALWGLGGLLRGRGKIVK